MPRKNILMLLRQKIDFSFESSPGTKYEEFVRNCTSFLTACLNIKRLAQMNCFHSICAF